MNRILLVAITALAAASLCLLALATRAGAVEVTYRGQVEPRQQFAVEVALLYWGGDVPACRKVVIGNGLTPDEADDADAYASGIPDRPRRRAYRCWIEFQPSVAVGDWGYLCRVSIHEVGHLLGLDHDDPSGLMAPSWAWSTPGSAYAEAYGAILFPPCETRGNVFGLHEGAIAALRQRCPSLDARRSRRACWQTVRRYVGRFALAAFL